MRHLIRHTRKYKKQVRIIYWYMWYTKTMEMSGELFPFFFPNKTEVVEYPRHPTLFPVAIINVEEKSNVEEKF